MSVTRGVLHHIGIQLIRSGRRLCVAFGRRSDFQATAAMAPERPVAVEPLKSTLRALKDALDARADSRRALRHLHMVEQTVELSGWRLDLLPLPVLQKALRELRVLMAGSVKDAGLERALERLQVHICKVDLYAFVSKAGARTRWQQSAATNPEGEIFFGEDEATQPMGLVDVPIDCHRPIRMNAGVRSA